MKRSNAPRLAAVLFGALALSGIAAAQTPPAPPAAVAPKSTEIFIAMRDGVKLAANVYLPDGKGPWPSS